MYKSSKLAIILSLPLLFAGCSTAPTKETQGKVVGGVVGGVVGNQIGGGSGRTIATIVGVVAGAAIGGSVGRSMDETDRQRFAYALESGRTDSRTQWVNPDTGYEYAVTPTRTYDSGTGPCREYAMDAWIGGEREEIYGTACRQPDGHWRIQN
jgi:surface antigen